MSTESTTAPVAKVILGCSRCGEILPEAAQFCQKCGKPVSSSPRKTVLVEEFAPPKAVHPRPRRRIWLWVLIGLLLGGLIWTATSDNPFAQGVQEFVGWKHDQTILDAPFTVSAHNFRYYKFALPEGSLNVSIVGQFSTTPTDAKVTKSKTKPEVQDGDVEVYVLSESAFAVWQNGYATSSVYESGRVSKGGFEAELPAGAGIYYLVFSNKFAPKAAKTVNSNVVLRYKSLLPDWFRRMKGRLVNWLGV